MGFKVKVNDRISRPAQMVYEAIVDPDQLTGYFASKSSGPLRKGSTVIWTFDDVGAELKVHVIEVAVPTLIQFTWEASGRSTQVDIEIEELGDRLTSIEILESDFEMNEEEVGAALQQTQGWTDFICSLKAYLYTGINLRKGKGE